MSVRQPLRETEQREPAAEQSKKAPLKTTRRKAAVRAPSASKSRAARRSEPAPAGKRTVRTSGQGKKASQRRARPNLAKPRT
jgi:hypothetical protein